MFNQDIYKLHEEFKKMAAKSNVEWQNFLEGCVDFRPNDGVFRIARDMFTHEDLFELEMQHIFEKVWIYIILRTTTMSIYNFII